MRRSMVSQAKSGNPCSASHSPVPPFLSAGREGRGRGENSVCRVSSYSTVASNDLSTSTFTSVLSPFPVVAGRFGGEHLLCVALRVACLRPSLCQSLPVEHSILIETWFLAWIRRPRPLSWPMTDRCRRKQARGVCADCCVQSSIETPERALRRWPTAAGQARREAEDRWYCTVILGIHGHSSIIDVILH